MVYEVLPSFPIVYVYVPAALGFEPAGFCDGWAPTGLGISAGLYLLFGLSVPDLEDSPPLPIVSLIVEGVFKADSMCGVLVFGWLLSGFGCSELDWVETLK